jgi:hypothetical protein
MVVMSPSSPGLPACPRPRPQSAANVKENKKMAKRIITSKMAVFSIKSSFYKD